MKKIYIDCDGVILDSITNLCLQKEKLGLYNHIDPDEFYKFFGIADKNPSLWEEVIIKAESLNKSVEIIRSVEDYKNITVLTKIHSLKEMDLKVKKLRYLCNITSPIVFVPGPFDKNEIVDATGNILIDDSEYNIKEWREAGGVGILFNSKLSTNTDDKIKRLDYILKK